jgi:hypothetical protein
MFLREVRYFHRTTQRYISEERILHSHRCGSFRSNPYSYNERSNLMPIKTTDNHTETREWTPSRMSPLLL